MKDIPLPRQQIWMWHANLEAAAIDLQVIGNEEKASPVACGKHERIVRRYGHFVKMRSLA